MLDRAKQALIEEREQGESCMMVFLSLKNFDQNMTYMLCQEEREQELMIQIGILLILSDWSSAKNRTGSSVSIWILPDLDNEARNRSRAKLVVTLAVHFANQATLPQPEIYTRLPESDKYEFKANDGFDNRDQEMTHSNNVPESDDEEGYAEADQKVTDQTGNARLPDYGYSI
ncbi:unnamed protein product [Rhizopus stolonifer]